MLTDIEQLEANLDVLEKFLHPTYSSNLRTTINRCLKAEFKRGKDLSIPKEWQTIEPYIIELRRKFANEHKGHDYLFKFSMRPLYKILREMCLTETEVVLEK